MEDELGFLGGGNMAEAIVRAAVQRKLLEPGRMIVMDPVPARREMFASLGLTTTEQGEDVIRRSRQIMLAIKPQTLPKLEPLLKLVNPETQVVLSIMAGIGTAKIEALAGKPLRIVRIMPNTPLMAGQGMAGVARGEHAREGDDDLAMKLFASAGKAVAVAESLLDAVTAVSGSGPAYLFYLAEAMTRAADELGLGEHADTLVRQTILGSAMLLAQSPDTPSELRRKVTSPGGTTEAAIRHMDSQAMTRIIVDAIAAACRRSRELGA
ncbi:MAG: pyrroline-5-carboxylate reductase [Phycisphaeraceae bacterium]|nr:pyrroline-5-carboxylate reductase [Phycisphaeraceae bacterium]